MKEKNITFCPNCNAPVRYYHSYDDGVITKVICSKHCQGMKVLQEINHKKGQLKHDTEINR